MSEPKSSETALRAQLDGLRKYEAAAWRQYDMAGDRQRAVVEELLRQPWPRTKR